MRKILSICLIFMGITVAYSQPFTIKGKVVDEMGEPYIGVSVILKGTTLGVITDIDGDFELTIPDLKVNNILVFRFIGTITQEFEVKGSETNITIVLKEEMAILAEVVVRADYSKREEKSIGRDPVAAYVDYTDGIHAGTLTAGEVNDFAKWNQWNMILTNDFSSYLSKWKIRTLDRYMAQITNKKGMPIANAEVFLQNSTGNIIWRSKTDNTGKAELWNNIFSNDETDNSNMKLLFDYNGKKSEIANAKIFKDGINNIVMDVPCNIQNGVDIFFMIDATGSMGDEIKYLQVELHDIIKKINKQQSQLQLRVGSLVYRDKGDEYLTRKSSLDPDINMTLDFLKEQRAYGGGDYPEAVDEALYEAINNENWNEAALARIAFIVLDAPAHDDEDTRLRIQEQIKLAAEKGIRVVPIICSGMDKDGEYLMRSIALATNGTYLFLTDDSGVGDPHMKPTTDTYDVEMLNDAIVRVVKQYTQMPDCNNKKWEKDLKKESPADKFVPNPSDEDPDDDVKTMGEKEVLKVYPNPCKDILKTDIKKEVEELHFMDMTGKTLINYKPSKDETVITKVTDFAAGVYFMKALYKGKWFTVKVIVSK